VMDYTTFTVDAPVSRTLFATKKYVNINSKGAYTLGKAYADHELIDLREP